MASSLDPTQRMVGVVKFFDANKNFGFILPLEPPEDNPAEEYFVHASCIRPVRPESERLLITGEYVEFALAPSDRLPDKYKAIEVTGLHGKGGRGGSLMTDMGTIEFKSYTRYLWDEHKEVAAPQPPPPDVAPIDLAEDGPKKKPTPST